MHERVARRFHQTIVTNQGLWIKAGQALGLQAALLPKPYRTAFSDIFDDAPTVPYAEIENVIKQDMDGKKPEEIFSTFEHVAVNSASIAQVHKATVKRAEIGKDGKPTGKTWMEDVAVKVSKRCLIALNNGRFSNSLLYFRQIQKPAIRKQVEWDLWCYRFLSGLAEKLFDMPSKPA
jgi:aarF domain-containing kinase